MRVLVTGAQGLVGSHLRALEAPDVDLIGVARETVVSEPGIDWVSADLTAPGFARKLPGGIDALIHLAQPREGGRLLTDAPAFVDVNVGSTARLLDFARSRGIRRFVLASTATVYKASRKPLTEDSELECSTLNSITKRTAEQIAALYREDLECRVMRVFTPYGSGQRGRLIADLLQRVESGAEITVHGDRGLPLSPIHASDVARAMLAAATDSGRVPGGYEVLNLGGPQMLTILEIGKAIGIALGEEPVFRFFPGPEPAGWWASAPRLPASFGLPAALTLAEGLRQTIMRTALCGEAAGRERGRTA